MRYAGANLGQTNVLAAGFEQVTTAANYRHRPIAISFKDDAHSPLTCRVGS